MWEMGYFGYEEVVRVWRRRRRRSIGGGVVVFGPKISKSFV